MPSMTWDSLRKLNCRFKFMILNISNQVVADAVDLRKRELFVFLIIAIIILATGLYPQFILETTQLASEHWIATLK